MNKRRKLENLRRLISLIEDISLYVDVVIVEGNRDIKAMRKLGYKGEIISYSQVGVNDYDLTDEVAKIHDNVLILTDFDTEGRTINHRLVSLFESRGTKVEMGLRWEIRRRMAALGLYAIEAIDDVKENEKYYY